MQDVNGTLAELCGKTSSEFLDSNVILTYTWRVAHGLDSVICGSPRLTFLSSYPRPFEYQ